MKVYEGVGLFILSVLCLVPTTSQSIHGQSFDTDLESELCKNTVQHANMIIDIHVSMRRGAKLLSGIWKENVEKCVDICCEDKDCDMALYKTDGVSDTGKNCYLVHCGGFDNCVMAEHTSFISVMLQEDAHQENTTENHTPASLSTTTTPITTTGSPTIPVTSLADQQTLPSTSNSSVLPSTVTPPTKVGVTVRNLTKSSNKQGSGGGAKHKSTSTKHKSTDSEVESKRVKDSCEECNGSGIVAVIVIGAIFVVIIIVLAAIIFKRVADERRRKKFRNVDYLINGMYT